MTSLLRFEVDRQKLRKFGVMGRGLQRAQRDALEAMGRRWHDTFLPLHFLPSAFERYGYTKRKGMLLDRNSKAFRASYAGRKERRVGHNRPLVFSGEGESLARLVQLRSNSKQVRVVLPRKYNFRHPKSRVSMRDEITRIIPSEAADLIAVARRAFKASIAKPMPE